MKMKIPIPREHGAWAMVYAPLAIAWATTGYTGPRIWLWLVAVTAFFFVHGPMFTLARLNPAQPNSGEQFLRARMWLITYLSLCGAAALPLLIFYRLHSLLIPGSVLLATLLLQAYLTSKRTERTISAELLAVLGLTSTGPMTRYVIVEHTDDLGLMLWILCILYFISSIFYIKMRVHRFAKKSSAVALTAHCALYHLFLIAALTTMVRLQWIPVAATLAFVPILTRAFWMILIRETDLHLKRVGIAEVAYTLLFSVFLALGL